MSSVLSTMQLLLLVYVVLHNMTRIHHTSENPNQVVFWIPVLQSGQYTLSTQLIKTVELKRN